MADLSKTDMKNEAQAYIVKALQEAQKKHTEQRVVNTIPPRQWEEFDEILDKQIERVLHFLGWL